MDALLEAAFHGLPVLLRIVFGGYGFLIWYSLTVATVSTAVRWTMNRASKQWASEIDKHLFKCPGPG
jgi:hypothetical protein